jgi:hypothetical protein
MVRRLSLNSLFLMPSNDTLESSKVTRVDRGVYRIRSQTESGVEYQCDVFANEGLGECDCKHFQFSLLPKYLRSIRIPFDSFRCKHLKRVRSYVLDAIIQAETKNQSKPKKGK